VQARQGLLVGVSCLALQEAADGACTDVPACTSLSRQQRRQAGGATVHRKSAGHAACDWRGSHRRHHTSKCEHGSVGCLAGLQLATAEQGDHTHSPLLHGVTTGVREEAVGHCCTLAEVRHALQMERPPGRAVQGSGGRGGGGGVRAGVRVGWSEGGRASMPRACGLAHRSGGMQLGRQVGRQSRHVSCQLGMPAGRHARQGSLEQRIDAQDVLWTGCYMQDAQHGTAQHSTAHHSAGQGTA